MRSVSLCYRPVAFTIERPSVIESLPYPTLHDQYERVMVAFVAIIGIENVIVFQLCVGAFPKYFADQFNNLILPEPPYYCQEGFCGASMVDCLCFASVCVAVIVVSVLLLIYGQLYRIREVLRVHQNLHAFDADSYRRLADQVQRMCTAFAGFDQKVLEHQVVRCGDADVAELKEDGAKFSKVGRDRRASDMSVEGIIILHHLVRSRVVESSIGIVSTLSLM